PPSVVMNAIIIDVLDEIALTLLVARYLFADAMLQTAVHGYSAQQSTRVGFAFLSVRPERFDFGMHQITAQNVPESDDAPWRKCVQAIAASVARIDAFRSRPARDLDLGVIRCEKPDGVAPLRVAWSREAVWPMAEVLVLGYPTVGGHLPGLHHGQGRI